MEHIAMSDINTTFDESNNNANTQSDAHVLIDNNNDTDNEEDNNDTMTAYTDDDDDDDDDNDEDNDDDDDDEEDDYEDDEADTATTYSDQEDSREFLRELVKLVPCNRDGSLRQATRHSVKGLPDGVRRIIEKFVGARFATYIGSSTNWPHAFKSNWWTEFNQTYAYGMAYPKRSFVPRLENGGYMTTKPFYFHYRRQGWKVPIHPSYDPTFVLQLKRCFNQLGLNGHLVISQIIGMPDDICLKVFA